MGLRSAIIDYSRGNDLQFFWWFYRRRQQAHTRFARDIWNYFLSRSAHRHGGYVGPDTVFAGEPSLPHGLHGIFISRYAAVGRDCRIYQNVTIGEVDGKAPAIGDGCLIGAGAVLVGGIHIGSHVRIGAGAVVCSDVPDNCTVVSQPPRIIGRGVSRDGTDRGWTEPILVGDRPEQSAP